MMKKIVGRKLQPNELAFVLRSIDTDHNGGISLEEFMKFTRRSQD